MSRASRQNLTLATICTVRIGRAETTWPNVGEFTTVSIVAYWTVLNTLLACTRIDRPRVPAKVTFRVSARLAFVMPGP